jgi:hypothetical protein
MSNTLDEKLSLLIKDQLPEFVRDNYDVFQAFLEEYYRFTEQPGEVQYNIQKAKSFANIDETSNTFIDYFLSQYAYNLPQSIFKDQLNQVNGLVSNTEESKRAIAKRLFEYHGTKGSEGAIRLLFRLLFDEEITIYYPKEDVFRPSDATWEQIKTIFLYSANANVAIDQYGGGIVEGVQSGASIILDEVYSLKYPYSANIVLYEMKIDNESQKGTFILGENVLLKTGNTTTGNVDLVANLKFYNTISQIDILDSGIGYSKGSFLYLDTVTVDNFVGLVEKVDDTGQLQKIALNVPINLSTEYNALSNITLIVSDTLQNYSGKFETSGNVATIALNLLANATPSSNVIMHGLDKGDLVNVAFTSGLTISENVYSVNSVVTSKRFTIANSIITGNVTGNVMIYGRAANLKPRLGAITNYSGTFKNKNSHVSDIKKVQDSDYYQDYSYVVRANQSSSLWKDIIRKSVHPAGMKLISEVFINLANAFTATSVIAAGAYNITLLRLQITNPIAADIPVNTLNQIIIESVGRVGRDVYKYRSGPLYGQDFDQFKFYNSSIRINNVENLTPKYISDNYWKIIQPQFALSIQVNQGLSNVILNSEFKSVSDWNLENGYAIVNGNLKITSNATGNAWQVFSSDADNKYMVNYEVISRESGSVTLFMDNTPGTTRSEAGRYSEIFWISSTSSNLKVSASSFTGNVSNVYVKKLVTQLG